LEQENSMFSAFSWNFPTAEFLKSYTYPVSATATYTSLSEKVP
jgi:hypothetical protein